MATEGQDQSALWEGKESIRRAVHERRRALDAAWAEAASRGAARRLAGAPEFAAARTVGAYMSLPHEVATGDILAACWREGKRVCVPAPAAGGGYGFVWLKPGEPLVPGPLRVPQPRDGRAIGDARIDAIVVPGVAFDRNGGRVGHGKGHYDRLLRAPAAAGAWKVGLAFEFQIVEEVPMAAFDVRMDAVVTESEIRRAAERGGMNNDTMVGGSPHCRDRDRSRVRGAVDARAIQDGRGGGSGPVGRGPGDAGGR